MLNLLIVDDELPARDELRYLLEQEEGVRIVGEADSGAAALTKAAELKPDVIFLDVEMRGMSGLEAGGVLRHLLPHSLIVFATAYDEYAIRAFELGAVDYVLKPFEQERLHVTLERIKTYRSEEWQAAAERLDATLGRGRLRPAVNKLPLDHNGKIVMVDYDAVFYAATQCGLVQVYTETGVMNYNGTLADLEERLADTHLVRVHKSYLVNLDKVREVVPWFKGTYWLKLEGCPEAEIPVSKSQIKEIKDMLGIR